jgi:hypothetical protein
MLLTATSVRSYTTRTFSAQVRIWHCLQQLSAVAGIKERYLDLDTNIHISVTLVDCNSMKNT